MRNFKVRALLIILILALFGLVSACDDATDPSAGDDATDADTTGDSTDADTSIPDADGDDDADGVDPDTDTSIPDTDGDADVELDGDADDTGDSFDVELSAEPAEVVECTPLTAPVAGDCEVTAGSNDAKIVRGNILADSEVFMNGEVLIGSDGKIACVGCDCGQTAEYDAATVVSCPGSSISPGLINAHDHITYDGEDPQPVPVTYDHRHEWRNGSNGKPRISYSRTSAKSSVQWTELRQLLAGTTSIIGSGSTPGMLRNLDRGFPPSSSDTEGLDYDSSYDTFPLDTSSLLESGCSGYADVAADFNQPADCYHAHVAEGTGASARNEFLCMAGLQPGGVDATVDRSAFVHMIPLNPSDVFDIVESKTAVVWSPRSNIALYGATAPVTMMHRLGAELTLGTDWTVSGSATILRELACADYLNTTHYANYFDSRDLWRLVTYGATQALELDGLIGRMEVGYEGDVAVFLPNGETDPFAQVIRATAANVGLVLRSGLTLSGDTAIVDQMPDWSGTDCETVQPLLAGKQKSACIQREFGTDFASLQSANNNNYGLAWNGVPTSEPSCLPARDGEYLGVTATDSDGDGIEDPDDNCPTIFNPILPVDDGLQPDFDSDSIGDACDPCPTSLEAECDLADYDSDTVLNENDNCPFLANAGQEDADTDLIGDVCDACPNFSNLNDVACPSPERTIYDVKENRRRGGVKLEGVVTVVDGTSFFLQVPEASHDSVLGYRYSGIYVFNSDSSPAVGDFVKIDGVVEVFFEQLQVASGLVEVVSSGNPVPSPVVVDPADVGTGVDSPEAVLGPDSLAYAGVLIQVEDAEVTTDGLISGRCCGSMDWGLDNVLRVGEELFVSTPPLIGTLVKVTGPLMLKYEDHKIMPRSADDIEVVGLADPRIASLAGDGGTIFAQVGGASLSFPAPLTVTLDRPAPAGGFDVAIGSLTVDVLTSGIVSFAEAETTKSISSLTLGVAPPVTGDTITVVAETPDSSVQVEVVTYDPAGERLVANVEPNPVQLATMSSGIITVFLDAPAGPGGVAIRVMSDNDSAVAPETATYSIVEGARSVEVTLNSGMLEATGELTVTNDDNATPAIVVDYAVSEIDTSLGLVISELFYDADTGQSEDGYEWVELYNGSTAPVDLSTLVIGRWGGSSTGNFSVFDITGTVAAGACVVIGGPVSDADNYNPVFDFSFDFAGGIENSGDQGDGFAIYPGDTNPVEVTSVPNDVVIYGPNNDKGIVGPDGNVAVADVGDAPKAQSISRNVSGWEILTVPTPGTCSVAGGN